MWFYLLVLDFTQGFFFLAVPKPTANESFSVGVLCYSLSLFPNSYMLDPHIVENNDKKG